MKRIEKERAIRLRHEGGSLQTIAQYVGVSKSTVSLWVRNLELSAPVRERIEASYSNGQRASQASLLARTSRYVAASKEDAELRIQDIPIDATTALIFCSLLYWCEGGKSRNDDVLTFSNSDPLIIKAYLTSLRMSVDLDESKFRVIMHLHDYHDLETQGAFWSRNTTVPLGQFGKTYIKPHTKKRIRPGYEGCVHIKYYDVRVARKIAATARAILGKVIEQGYTGP